MLPTRAYVFMVLNAVRAVSIIALLLVFASSIFVMVNDIRAVNAFTANPHAFSNVTGVDAEYIPNSTVPHQPAGVFWAVLNRLLIIFQVIILLLSEISWPQVFFERFFPVLSDDFGLGPIGIFQCLLGAAILSHHTDDFTLVSAFFLFSIGCLNMTFGLIFREKAKAKRCILSWKNESKAVFAEEKKGVKISAPLFTTAMPQPTFLSPHDEEMGYGWTSEKSSDSEYETWRTGSAMSNYKGYGFGKAGEKAAGLKGFLLTRPVEALPRYASPSPAYSAPSRTSPGRPPSLTLSTGSSAPSSRPSTPDGSKSAPVFKSSGRSL